MNQNEREGKSIGRTTGASGEDAEQQQDRTIEGQESQPGKVWQETDQSRFTGQSDTSVGGTDPRGGDKDDLPENEQIDETQWQGNRFGQGGFGSGNQGGSNG